MTNARRAVAAMIIAVAAIGTVVLLSGGSSDDPGADGDRPVATISRQPATGSPVAAASVGFLGDEDDLLVIDGPDSAPDGTVWKPGSGYLRINVDDIVLDGVYVIGGVDFYGSGTLTIRNSIIEGGNGSWQTIMLRDTGNRLELSDSTLRWNPAQEQKPGSGPGSIQVTGQHSMRIVRNDISGMPDGIQASGDDIVITDNWIHDPAVLGIGPESTHNDGIQLYEGSSNVQFARNRIEIGSVEGHSNGAIFIAGASSGVVSDNYLDGGGYSLRISDGSWSVTGNEFGPNHLFSQAAIENVELSQWEDNTDANAVEVQP